RAPFRTMATMMQSDKHVTLGELVSRFGGELQGSPDTAVTAIAPLDAAGSQHLSFLSNPKLRSKAADSKAAALILKAADSEALGASYGGARIITGNPYAYFARVAQYFFALHAPPVVPGIHPSAVVDSS